MKNFKPFIREFFVFLFVIAIFVYVVACGDYIKVDIKPCFISYCALIFFGLSVGFPYKNIIKSGVASIIDYLCKTRGKTKAVFLGAYQKYGSTFSDRFTKEGMRTFQNEVRYIYMFKQNKRKILLQSVELLDLVPSNEYYVVYGKYSKIILSISKD